MLFNYYNRKSIGSVKPDQPQESQQDHILESFYQQRRSRSTNVKHHNLLKKNISFFHQEQQQPQPPVQQEINKSHQLSNNVINTLNQSQKIIPTSSSHNLTQTQPKNIPPLPKSNTSKQLTNKPPLLTYSTHLQPSSQTYQESSKEQLKYENNKRISIKNYLTQMQQQNKQNKLDKHNSQIPNQMLQTTTKLKHSKKQPSVQVKLRYKYDSKISEVEENSIMQDLSRITSNSKDSRVIYESKHSKASNSLLQQHNFYEISKNHKDIRQDQPQQNHNNNHDDYQDPTIEDIKYKYSQKSFSLKRNSLPTLGQSRQLSSNSNSRLKKKDSNQDKKCQKNVLMAQEELTYLDQNSHPLRQTTEKFYKHQPVTTKQTFFEPEKQSFYKRKIKDLEKQIESLNSQHRRQQKFIQSIFKMRRVMLNEGEDCTLKQLWRWIKELPSAAVIGQKRQK